MHVCYIFISRAFTWGYIGIEGVPGVTRGYRGVQLQRIRETFFLATTSLDILSSFILHKNQS